MRRKVFLILLLMLIVLMVSNFSLRGCIAIEEVNNVSAIPSNPTLEDNSSDVSVNNNTPQPQLSNIVVAAGGKEGIFILDVSNKSNPKIISSSNTAGWAEGVQVSGNYAHIADGGNGLVIVDITDPTNPELVTKMPLTALYGLDYID